MSLSRLSRLPRLSSLLPRRLLSTSAPSPASAAEPVYKTPGPPVTRRSPHKRGTTGPYEIAGEPRPFYPKRRSPLKRSTALINALNEEEQLRMVRDGRAIFPQKIPRPRSGDIIRVTYVQSLSDVKMTQCFTGICMAVRKRGIGSTVVLRNVVQGIAVERGFPMYSPLIRDAEILGRKKVRRAKLYYLRDKPLKESTIPNATKKPPHLLHQRQ